MQFRASEIATATDGRLVGPDVAVDGAAIDSRALVPGQLFVAVVGERDGHDFIVAAVRAGAPAYLTARAPIADVGGTAIAVDDTAAALLDIGRAARGRLDAAVIGITGSVGKTTVKDLTAAALAPARRVAASPRSFNNELGVPLTLANAPGDTEAAVIEMGARGEGHIAVLCSVARPDIGVVTAIAAAHTEMFGSVDAVARAKGELVEALPASGTAVLNAADRRVAAMAARTAARVLTYGTPASDLGADDVRLDERLRPSFRLRSPWGVAAVTLAVSGEHQVGNALAAAGAALAAGAGLDDVAAGFAAAELSPWRMEWLTAPSGAVVVNDAYNANPTSMAAALRALAALPADRRTAVLGPMAELGKRSAADHRAVAELARSLGITLVAFGTDAYGVDAAADLDAVLARLGALGPGDAVLVKASRVAALERVAAALTRPGGPGQGPS